MNIVLHFSSGTGLMWCSYDTESWKDSVNHILVPYYCTKRCLDNILLEVSIKGLKMKQSYNGSQDLLLLAISVI